MKARDFLERIIFKVNLNSLYTVHSATNFSHFDRFSAVILRLGHRMRRVKNPSCKRSVIRDRKNYEMLLELYEYEDFLKRRICDLSASEYQEVELTMQPSYVA